MDTRTNTTIPFSQQDKDILSKIRDKAYFSLCKTYFPFFLGLVYVYYRMTPGSTFRGHKVNNDMTMSEYNLVFWVTALVLGGIFSFFLIRDYRRRIIPLQKEMRSAIKYCIPFSARKYKDPLYNKCLLFYPGKEDFYIEVAQEDFDEIRNGEDMLLEASCITGEVLLLKSENRTCKYASEFSFSDDVIESSGNK